MPYEIEHIYPDYSLYSELTKDKAYGFLTRGCCNNCSFCVVSKKEGLCSIKVADLSEFWRGQKYIDILDANILACIPDRMELLQQLVESKAYVNFNQGLDARFITEEIAYKLKEIKLKTVHFAFDFMKNEKAIIRGLKCANKILGLSDRNSTVYMLTNYDTNFQEDFYRVKMIQSCGFQPDIRVYRKNTAPKITRDLQRWCNSRFIYRSTDFWEYEARGKKMKEWYPLEYEKQKI